MRRLRDSCPPPADNIPAVRVGYRRPGPVGSLWRACHCADRRARHNGGRASIRAGRTRDTARVIVYWRESRQRCGAFPRLPRRSPGGLTPRHGVHDECASFRTTCALPTRCASSCLHNKCHFHYAQSFQRAIFSYFLPHAPAGFPARVRELSEVYAEVRQERGLLLLSLLRLRTPSPLCRVQYCTLWKRVANW
jgi:hypothetical protein